MRYINARNTAYGEDRRTYKESDSGVSSTQRVFNVSYDNGRVEAYLNGVRLFPGDDYTKTSSGIGTSITLASDLGSNNVLEIVGYQGINSGNTLVEDNFVVGTGSTGSGGSYTNSTTEFPVASSVGDTVSVWRNGIKLVPTTDYTVQASVSTVTLASPGASTDDEITVQVVGGVIHNNGLTVNSGNDSYFLPTTRGSDNYVLTRDDSAGTGGTAWKETALAPTITSIKYSEQTSGTFVENTGQTATEASASTPELCQIIGQNFNASMTISVGGTSAGSIVVNSGGTQATFTPPSKSAGSYTLIVTNPNGLTANISISYDADPAWVTGANADLGDFVDGLITGTNGPQIIASEDGSNLTTGYKQVTSNSDNTVITSGVAGLTIGDNGYLTGQLAGTNGAQNNFYAIAVDNEGQQSAIRQFHFVSYDYAGNGGQNFLNNSGDTIRYHVFTNTGTSTFQVISSSLTVDILLVAGGAGSGLLESGGGGAGEVVWKEGLVLSAGTYNAVVGTGGIGTNITSNGSRAQNGGESSFAWGVSGKQIRAKGGGAGGVNGSGNQAGLSGGSGGGSSRDGNQSSGATASKYGTGSAGSQQGLGFASAGGYTPGNGWASASGGGGAGGAGDNGSGAGPGSNGDAASGGDGGIGFKGADVGTYVTDLMNDCSIGTLHGGVRYLAGGGGGSCAHTGSAGSLTAGAGGNGGGGAGALDSNTGTGVMATPGTDNTGGGAGGSLRGATGVNGGSGIIVIRYAI